MHSFNTPYSDGAWCLVILQFKKKSVVHIEDGDCVLWPAIHTGSLTTRPHKKAFNFLNNSLICPYFRRSLGSVVRLE